MWENIKQISLNAYHFFDSPIFSIGDSDVSALSISYFIGATILVFVFATQIKRLFVKKIFPRYHVEIGLSEAVATIIKYVVTILGLIILFGFCRHRPKFSQAYCRRLGCWYRLRVAKHCKQLR